MDKLICLILLTLSFNAFSVGTVECPNCETKKEIALYGAASIYKREEHNGVQFPISIAGSRVGMPIIFWNDDINQIFVYSKGKVYLVEMKYHFSKATAYGFLIPDFTMTDVWLSEVDGAYSQNWPFDNDHIGLIVDALELEDELETEAEVKAANINVATKAAAEGIRSESIAQGFRTRIGYYASGAGRRYSFKIVEL